MAWFWWAIAAAGAFAVLNILDKFLLLRFAKSVIMAVRVQSLFSLLIFILGMLYFQFPIEITGFVIAALIGGVIEVLYIYFYLRALETSLVSYVAMAFALSPVLILAGSLLLGYEPISTQALLGIIGAMGGVYLFTYALDGPVKKKVQDSSWILLPLAVIFYAASVLFQDQALGTTLSLIEVVLWTRLGIFIGGVCIVTNKEKLLHKKLFSSAAPVFAFSEVAYLVSIYFLFQALTTGNPGLVDGVVNTQPLFVLFLSGALYIFFPKLLKEDFSFYSLPLGVIAIIITIASLSLLPA